MHLILCVDDKDGMSFCGRRQSRDREVAAHILKLTHGCKLWVSPYTAQLFPAEAVWIHEDPQRMAGAGEFCFEEIRLCPDMEEKPESVIVYHWNRTYPSTEKFPRQVLAGMTLESTLEFSGYSHETVTMERYLP